MRGPKKSIRISASRSTAPRRNARCCSGRRLRWCGDRRHCERSEAIQKRQSKAWIASSLSLLAMTGYEMSKYQSNAHVTETLRARQHQSEQAVQPVLLAHPDGPGAQGAVGGIDSVALHR